MRLVKENSPYIRRKANVMQMMLDVIIALVPLEIFAIIMYGFDAVYVILLSVFTMVAAEAIFVGIINRPKDEVKRTLKEKLKIAYSKYTINNLLAPIISGLIFALIMPAGTRAYIIIVGALFGIIVGKLLFGGLGSNIFNPAATAKIITLVCFSGFEYQGTKFFDVVAGGTPLGQLTNNLTNINNYSLTDMFFGLTTGAMGEGCSLLIIIGGIYLLVKRSADFRPMVAMILTFSVIMLVAGLKLDGVNAFKFMLYQLLAGGILFGSIYMVTDPVTSPTTKFGRIIYGSLIAIIACLIRLFGAFPEGVAFAILIMNMFVPVIDYYKWSSSRYNYKQFIVLGSIIILALVIVYFGL